MHVVLSVGVAFDLWEVLAQPRPSQWAHVWPTALAISRWLLEQAPASLPTHATELGCGVGLVSVTLAHLGLVTEGTDREPRALVCATRNAARNGVQGFTASLLDWGEPGVGTTSLLVASDIVYEAETPARLVALVNGGHLLAPLGRFVLGVPLARSGFADELVALLVAVGYAHESQGRDVEWEGRVEAIVVHVLTRPG